MMYFEVLDEHIIRVNKSGGARGVGRRGVSQHMHTIIRIYPAGKFYRENIHHQLGLHPTTASAVGCLFSRTRSSAVSLPP